MGSASKKRNVRLDRRSRLAQVAIHPRARRWAYVLLPKPAMAGLILLIVALLLVVVVQAVRTHRLIKMHGLDVPASRRTFSCAPGPWGDVECTRILIEIPDDFVDIDQPLPKWYFTNVDRHQLQLLFDRMGLTGSAAALVLATAEYDGPSGSYIISPGEQFILSLTPEQRQELYNLLGQDVRNFDQNEPFRFRADDIEDWFDQSGVLPETEALVRKLLYRRGASVLFSDMPVVLRKIESNDEKRRLVKTMSRVATLLMRVKITPESDVAGLADYWGNQGSAKDLLPLLESLKKVPDGASLDVAHLLPPFPRKRLYTYPLAADTDANHNCYWSSLNFVSDEPDDTLVNLNEVSLRIEREYREIFGDDRQFGDVIFLMESRSTAIHACIYIADDIVFTKNGPGRTSPWILAKLSDVLAYYPSDKELSLRTFRRRLVTTTSTTSGDDD